MKKNTLKKSKYEMVAAPVQVTDEIVIPDECGDSMWDAVLAQRNNR